MDGRDGKEEWNRWSETKRGERVREKRGGEKVRERERERTKKKDEERERERSERK